ncbi:MAG: TM2 domain-containing protein [Verrucomicrobiales bacterium]|jgi:hypothetical protein|nr:TM2 domain-containing protein [Verrucomicrobiales bacterium]
MSTQTPQPQPQSNPPAPPTVTVSGGQAGAPQVVVQIVSPSAPAPASAPVPKSRAAYVLLAIFFGGLGIHNFYAGRMNQATAQLLMGLFCLGVPSWVWALVECFTVSADGAGVKFE